MKLRIVPKDPVAIGSTPMPMLSPDGRSWCLLDGAHATLPAPHAVILTGADKDQVDGLFELRAGAPIKLYATPSVVERLTEVLPVLPVLQQYCGVQWHLIAVAGDRRDASFMIAEWPTLHFTAITLGTAPAGERIALAVHDAATGRRLFIAPAAAIGPSEMDWLRDADCVLLSGPLPTSAAPHWFRRMAELPSARKLLLHGPADTTQDAALAAHGIERAYGGMEIGL